MTKKSALHSNGKKLATQRICRPAPPTHGKQARADLLLGSSGHQVRADLKSDRNRTGDLQSPTQTQRPSRMLL